MLFSERLSLLLREAALVQAVEVFSIPEPADTVHPLPVVGVFDPRSTNVQRWLLRRSSKAQLRLDLPGPFLRTGPLAAQVGEGLDSRRSSRRRGETDGRPPVSLLSSHCRAPFG